MTWDPFKVIEDMIRNMRRRMQETERMMNELLRDLLGSESTFETSYKRAISTIESGQTEPLASIYEEGDYVIIAISVPGARRESIDVRVFEDKVEVEASLDVNKFSRAWGSTFRYTSISKYKGTYPLPNRVDPSTARYEIKGDIVLIKVKKSNF